MNRLSRLSKIVRTAIRYRLDTFIEPEQLPARVRWLLLAAPWRLLLTPKQPRGERLRLALEQLGPIFVKFGQLLSTRRDLLPDDVADQLAKLQDQVPPFASQQSIAIIEQALGQSIEQLFSEFSHEPMASASVAQVHAARLHSGEEVVVKVIRPGIEKTIQQDIALLFMLARFIHRYLPDGKRLRPEEIVADYQHTILDELDLQREGANTSQLHRNFEHSDLLYVPKVYWDYTRRNVLVMERIHGIAVTDIDALRTQQTNMKLLAERGVEIFFTQLLRDNFFHADMHPGNIFVAREHPDSPQYIAIDCAIIGTLSQSDQYYLARNLLAIFRRDYREVAELHIECGWIPSSTKAHEFEAAIRSVCEPIFEKPLADISFGKLLIYLFQTARRFDMEVQPSLVLLQKTLLNIEGLGRQLYPQLNLWDTAKPFLEQWLKERYSPLNVYRKIQRQLPGWLEQLPQLPETFLDHLTQAKQLRTLNDNQQAYIEQLKQEMKHRQKQRRRSKLAIMLLAVAAVVTSAHTHGELSAISQTLAPISWLLLAAAGLLWLRL